MTKISNLYSLTNYITANSSGSISIAPPTSGFALEVSGSSRFTGQLSGSSAAFTGDLNGASATFSGTSGAYIGVTINNTDASGSSRLRITSTGSNITDVISYSASHASRANQAWIGGDGSSTITVLQAGGVEFLRGASTGVATFSSNLGVAGQTPRTGSGVKSIESTNYVLEDNGDFGVKSNAYYNGTNNIYINNGYANRIYLGAGTYNYYDAPNSTAGGTVSFTQRFYIANGGNVGIGATTFLNSVNFQMSAGSGDSSSASMGVFNTAATPTSSASTVISLGFISGTSSYVATNTVLGALQFLGQANDAGYGATRIEAVVTTGGNVGRSSHAADMVFYTKAAGTTGNAERMRITSGGDVYVGATTIPGAGSSTTGASLGNSGFIIAQRNAATVGYFGRGTNDGELFAFYRGTTQVGAISVTGSSVSFTSTSSGGLTIGTSGAATFANNVTASGYIYTNGNLATANGNQTAGATSATLFLGNRGYFTSPDTGAATIRAVSSGPNWYSGTALSFSTNPGGDVTSTSAVERVVINSDGRIQTYINGTNGQFQIFQQNAGYSPDAMMYMFNNRNATSGWNFAKYFSGYPDNTQDVEFNFRGDGTGYSDGGWTTPASDYAEYFESTDGTALQIGATVVLENGKIKVSTESSTDIIGVIRPKNAALFLGNNQEFKWNQKYLKDDFGAYILDDEGMRTLNPQYDPNLEYISRENRDEWNVVGLVGQVPILKTQPKHPSWIKMYDVSDTVEMWLIK